MKSNPVIVSQLSDDILEPGAQQELFIDTRDITSFAINFKAPDVHSSFDKIAETLNKLSKLLGLSIGPARRQLQLYQTHWVIKTYGCVLSHHPQNQPKATFDLRCNYFLDDTDSLFQQHTTPINAKQQEGLEYLINFSVKTSWLEQYPGVEAQLQEVLYDLVDVIVKDSPHNQTQLGSFHLLQGLSNWGSLKSLIKTIPPVEFNALHYAGSPKTRFEELTSWVKSDESGIALLYGPSGTGKSWYLRMLISQFSASEGIIYAKSEDVIQAMSNTNFLQKIREKSKLGSVTLILEDAEALLVSRETGDSPSTIISGLLNTTDGILADIYPLKIIATFNTSFKNIDKALTRPGRLKFNLEFDKLDVEQANQVLSTLNASVKVTKPTTLAALFNHAEVPDHATKPIGF